MTAPEPPNQIPSALTGLSWPAVPGYGNAAVLALARQMEASQWWPPDRIWDHQARQLAALCAHAARTVPYYRDTLAAFAGDAPPITPESWAELPVLTRKDIQDAGGGLRSTAVPRNHGRTADVSTSGSTGQPVTVTRTAHTGNFLRVTNLRYHVWHRREFGGVFAGIRSMRGAMLKHYEAGTAAAWVPAYKSGPMYMFPVTRPVGEQVDWLLKLNPDYLTTLAGNVPHLIDETRRRGVTLPKLREVSTLGDSLPEGLRERCLAEWGVALHDLYSCQEIGTLALECPDHPHYHVQSEAVLVEVVDGNGAPCPPGTAGRVLLTDLHNFAMPLIRYEIGDYAVPGEPCPCGRGLPVLERVVGRFRNLLVLPDGRRFRPRFLVSDLMKIAPVRQMQLVQHTRTELEARLVTDRPLTPEEEDGLRAEVLVGTDHPFTIAITRVDAIPRSAGGKYEDVVCLVEA